MLTMITPCVRGLRTFEGRPLATVATLIAISASSLGAQATDVFVPAQKAMTGAAALERFKPDLEAVDGPFECSPREVMRPNVIVYNSYAPTVAEPRATVIVFVDTLGQILRYSERRGRPINPDTKGLSPAEISKAVAAAADEFRSTTISVDVPGDRAVVGNKGGGRPAELVVASPRDIMNLEKLGRPAERAARVLAVCRDGKS
jgi:hypothetical protein